jgi:hypothetical protein
LPWDLTIIWGIEVPIFRLFMPLPQSEFLLAQEYNSDLRSSLLTLGIAQTSLDQPSLNLILRNSHRQERNISIDPVLIVVLFSDYQNRAC